MTIHGAKVAANVAASVFEGFRTQNRLYHALEHLSDKVIARPVAIFAYSPGHNGIVTPRVHICTKDKYGFATTRHSPRLLCQDFE